MSQSNPKIPLDDPELVWVLRGFAIPYSMQLRLYAPNVPIADLLACDLGCALDRLGVSADAFGAAFQRFDAAILEISGIDKWWWNDALEHDPHWEHLRGLAAAALLEAGLEVMFPGPSPDIVIVARGED